jgi:hypothetical protein
MAVLHPAGIVTTKADWQSARRRCCGFNSNLLAGQFVEPLSDRGGVIDDRFFHRFPLCGALR